MRTCSIFLVLFLTLFLLPLFVPVKTPVGLAAADTERATQREVDRLRRSLEAMREQSVLTAPLLLGASIPDHAPRFSTRAACVVALGFASVGAQERLVCRAIVDRFPFESADPTPARLEMMPLPADADRG